MVLKSIQGIFRTSKVPENQLSFGIPFQDWERSLANPLVQRRLKFSGKKKDGDDEEEEEPEEIPDPDRKLPWWDAFIIGHRNMTYLCFEILMCALCIVSSYFYASMMGFRYTFEEEERQRVMTTMLVFEAFFVV